MQHETEAIAIDLQGVRDLSDAEILAVSGGCCGSGYRPACYPTNGVQVNYYLYNSYGNSIYTNIYAGYRC
ncbi:hypothetical protein [Burkholderia cenocepacia]|uniref:hypothetical protein n=1 Tax=Burkholderia cenocepacia TaxID=95486 RepID=UPI001BA793D1|nr:hypothetical protein [Burkholderia cenocepacia]QUN38658.1 hypothetical protein KEH56_10550 [Burkholderia cenocepacia]QUO29439.1 hypothetical protein KEH57_23425 [Burkholderia cenocepacia]